jgi:hypothetical protein
MQVAKEAIMGISTNGSICYGILFDEDFEFPWDDEENEGYIEDWWENFNEDAKCPVEIVNVCSCDYPIYILAVKGSVRTCRRGYPTDIDMNTLLSSVGAKEHQELLEFCDKYKIDTDEETPKWWLGSLMC